MQLHQQEKNAMMSAEWIHCRQVKSKEALRQFSAALPSHEVTRFGKVNGENWCSRGGQALSGSVDISSQQRLLQDYWVNRCISETEFGTQDLCYKSVISKSSPDDVVGVLESSFQSHRCHAAVSTGWTHSIHWVKSLPDRPFNQHSLLFILCVCFSY